MIGTKLGKRYELLERIGGGGMSLVYKAHDTLLNRTVAVKVLRAQYASDDDVVRRLRREAQAAASLSHPNIVGIYDVGEQDDIHYIVMEYVAGRTLKQLIQKSGPLPTDQALDITIQVCEALEHAHAHKVVHRDIKPHNILLTPAGKVKVADFGIARAATSSTLTHSGTIIGSVHYFSPEQARGSFTGEKSDLYSVGVVMYEMLTGKLPFEGDSAITVALKHIQEPVIPPRKLLARVPEQVERIVMKALEKDQQNRYQSATDMLRDIARVAKVAITRPAEVTAEDDGSLEKTRVMPQVIKSAVGNDERSQRAKKKRGMPWGLLLLLVAVMAGAFVYGLGRWFNVASVPVPDVRDKSLTEAQRILREAKLAPTVVAEKFDDKVAASHIISQQPEGGQTVKQGRTINLVVSMGQEFTVVPDIQNKPLREAGIQLNSTGLEVGTIRSKGHPTVPADSVITQNPRAGTRVPKGTLVDVEVSAGPEVVSVPVPNFLTENIDSVLQKLPGLRLTQGTLTQRENPAPPGSVIEQEPAPGAEVKEGTPVNLVVSRGPGGQTKRGTVTFRVPGTKDLVNVRVTLTDSFGTRVIYQQRQAPGTTIRVQAEWAGPEARVLFFVDDQPVSEEVLR